MSDAGKLVGFALVLGAALGVGFGVGTAVGPIDPADESAVVETGGDLPVDHD